MVQPMKTTKSNFCKLAKDFGIKLCGDKPAKKFSIYGHDNMGFFYCDRFPAKYAGTTPTLRIERFRNHQWVSVDEKSRTTEMIWNVYVKSGKLQPISYKDFDCKHNRSVKAAIERRQLQKDMHTPWRLTYGKHNSYCDGFDYAGEHRQTHENGWLRENEAHVGTCPHVERFDYVGKITEIETGEMCCADLHNDEKPKKVMPQTVEVQEVEKHDFIVNIAHDNCITTLNYKGESLSDAFKYGIDKSRYLRAKGELTGEAHITVQEV